MTVPMRRVVVTGLGICCPLGTGVRRVWKALLDGHSGIGSLPKSREYEGIPSQVAGFVPLGDGEGELNEDDWVSEPNRKRMCLGSTYSLCAASEAFQDAKWFPESEEERTRTGVSVGSSGTFLDFGEIGRAMRNPKKLSPYLIPRNSVNMHAGYISIRFNIQGPVTALSISCSTATNCIGDSAMKIERGHADVMLAGGVEHCRSPLVLAGLCRMQALSTKFNNSPQEASRPFDSLRNGFVASEGAGMLVLEEMEHAKRRGARIYAEVLGYGLSSDAHHITAPLPGGEGIVRCLSNALRDAKLPPSAVGYVNAHATSTPLGDAAENSALKKLFGEHAYKLMVSSNKSAFGHLLGASGAVEAIVTVLSVREGRVTPTLNMTKLEPEFDLNYVPNRSAVWDRSTDRRIALSNSFGFGGTNAALCFGEI